MSERFGGRAVAVEFGLIGWLEQTKVRLPLKGVECRFLVSGDLANVEVDQIFHQTSSRALDCIYTFPLPGGAAVYRCEMHVNGRIVRAKVEERGRARELAREKRAAGYRTALVEMERENLFTLSLGNLQPDDLVVIRFAYFQTLTRLQDWTSLRVPFCPGVRYIPGQPLLRKLRGQGVIDDTDQVPDASRITPPRLDALHPEAAYLHVAGELEDPLGSVREISSPSHPVLVRDGEKRFGVSLAEDGTVPDQDFVLRWTEVVGEELAPGGWLLSGDRESYALVRLQAPRPDAREDDAGQDVYFLLDRSGSMEGLKWQRAVEAFRAFAGNLGAKDRVWLTLFETRFEDLAEEPLPAAKVLGEPVVQDLERFGTGGGTELLPALLHVVEKAGEHSSGRRICLVLITDGQVGNEAEILRRLKGCQKMRMHTFGIDTAVNDAFLEQVAAQQGGTCHLVTPTDDIVGTVARLGGRLRAPVLLSIQLPEPWELPGEGIPDLHAGETTCWPLRGSPGTRGMVVRGRLADGSPISCEVALEPTRNEALRLLWIRGRIRSLEARGEGKAALALARANNLLCSGAAFVAWDESEKVGLSGVEVYQPALESRLLHQVALCKSALRTDIEADMVADWTDVFDSRWFGQPPTGPMAPLRRRQVDYRRQPVSQTGPEHFFRELARKFPALQPSRLPRRETLEELAVWRCRVENVGVSFAPLSLEIFEMLCFWVLLKPWRAEWRLRKLRKLLRELCREKGPVSAKWMRLGAWIEAQVDDPASLVTQLTESFRRAAPDAQRG